MGDKYLKVILTVIAATLIWIAVNHHGSTNNGANTNDLSNQIADLGDAIDNLQQSVNDIASDVTSIKDNQQ